MRTLTVRVVTQRKIQCPICRAELQSNCVRFIDSLAYCYCCGTPEHADFQAKIAATWSKMVALGWIVTQNGLEFFAPTVTCPPRMAAHLAALQVSIDEKQNQPISRTGIDSPAREWTHGQDDQDDRDQT